ncbi:MAG TPA: hypothetical protein VFN38_08145 [Gemmatimonadaceae bacterium]|nr:hypothetical protein [Gemmatimonadaceae bacterium]
MGFRRLRASATLLFTMLLGAPPTGAQHAPHGEHAAAQDREGTKVMAQAIPLVTHAAPTPGGVSRTEVALTQTIVMAKTGRWRDRFAVEATLDAEGLTMPRGELTLGAFGEGFVDRRHPHTWLHELMLVSFAEAGPALFSVGVGRGFVPFGTDDPMVRPFVKYPVNHHLAQILERGMATAAARIGFAALEVATFTGEEPQNPSSLPLARRFGDSWSVRATLFPAPGLELQSSHARVSSPEVPDGFGLDQRKRSVSARLGTQDGGRYALAEWARTVEHDHARRLDAFAYESALLEVATPVGPVRGALRFEQTDRPEEERLSDPFRTARPATDLHIVGVTRWRTATMNLTARPVTQGPVAGTFFIELARLSATSRDAVTTFDPATFYGGRGFWSLTLGVRLRTGHGHDRMGRYGVASDPSRHGE